MSFQLFTEITLSNERLLNKRCI